MAGLRRIAGQEQGAASAPSRNRSLLFQQLVSAKGFASFYSLSPKHLDTHHCVMVMLQVVSGFRGSWWGV